MTSRDDRSGVREDLEGVSVVGMGDRSWTKGEQLYCVNRIARPPFIIHNSAFKGDRIFVSGSGDRALVLTENRFVFPQFHLNHYNRHRFRYRLPGVNPRYCANRRPNSPFKVASAHQNTRRKPNDWHRPL